MTRVAGTLFPPTAVAGTPSDGMLRYNATARQLETYDGTGAVWRRIGSDGIENTAESEFMARPRDNFYNGFVVKSPSADWHDDPALSGYGHAQAFMLLKEGAFTTEPDDAVLARIDGHDGSFGTGGGIHLATGFRQRTGETFGFGMWIDPSQDLVGITITPDAAQTKAIIDCSNPGGTTLRWLIGPGPITYETRMDDGSAAAWWVSATSAGAFGTRQFVRTGATGTKGISVKGELNQTADLQEWTDEVPVVRARIRPKGDGVFGRIANTAGHEGMFIGDVGWGNSGFFGVTHDALPKDGVNYALLQSSVGWTLVGAAVGQVISFTFGNVTKMEAGEFGLDFVEIGTPAAPGTNRGRLFTRDNGAGKTQLCIRFNTGAVQVLATQP